MCDVETEGMRNITVKSGQHLVHFFITNLYGVAGASSVLSFHDHLEEMRESAGRKAGFEDAVRDAQDYARATGGGAASASSSPPRGRERSKTSPSDTSRSESTSPPPRTAQRSMAKAASATVDASGVVRVGAPQFSGRIIAPHQPAERSAASVAELMCGPSGGNLGVKRLHRSYGDHGCKRYKPPRPVAGEADADLLLHLNLNSPPEGENPVG